MSAWGTTRDAVSGWWARWRARIVWALGAVLALVAGVWAKRRIDAADDRADAAERAREAAEAAHRETLARNGERYERAAATHREAAEAARKRRALESKALIEILNDDPPPVEAESLDEDPFAAVNDLARERAGRLRGEGDA